MTPRTIRPLDPLAPAPGGCYRDDLVTVTRTDPTAGQWHSRTAHFAIGSADGRLVVRHALGPQPLDDVAALVADELFTPGWVNGADVFERIVAGIVLSSDDDPLAAWSAFYRASLSALESDRADGLLPVWRRAEQLVVGDVLDLGSCFGLLPLRLSMSRRVMATDVSAGTCRLLSAVSRALDRPLRVVRCDAAAVPAPDRYADTVLLLHLLEHVDAEHGERILAEAVRLARRRVVVAVPLESEPAPEHGHLRVLTLADLTRSATAFPAWSASVEEHHGGWLVLERESHEQGGVAAHR
jgi:hypothetical protein